MLSRTPSTHPRDLPFSAAFQQALRGAKVEAGRVGDSHVRAEHVLLALVREGTAPRAVQVLKALGVPPDHLRLALDRKPAPAVDAPAELPWDRRAKAVLDRCIAYARESGRSTTDHLLLALAEGKGGLAAELLQWRAITAARVREAAAALPEGGAE